MQIAKMFSYQQSEDAIEPIQGHADLFHKYPNWLVAAWVGAGKQTGEEHTMQKSMLSAFWYRSQPNVLEQPRTDTATLCPHGTRIEYKQLWSTYARLWLCHYGHSPLS